MQHRFFEVDVFATGPFSGNPLAVVADADDLTAAQMLRIARWCNFSETAFLSTDRDHTGRAADYAVRIFSPTGELPFAGHPTLGSARVYAELAGLGESTDPAATPLRQACPAGTVEIRRAGDVFSFAAPPLVRSGALDDAELAQACAFLGLDPAKVDAAAWVDNGAGWRMLLVPSLDMLRGVRPDFGAPCACKVGVVALTQSNAGPALEVRAFTPGYEDPVTGSLHAGVAHHLRAHDLVPAHYTATQGSAVGRAGLVHVDDDGQHMWVGGAARIRVSGHIDIDEAEHAERSSP